MDRNKFSNKIFEAVVLGVPVDLLGNKLVALAVKKKGEVDEQAILCGCSKIIPKYKMPETLKLIRPCL